MRNQAGRRVVSPVVVGRDDELATIEEAIRRLPRGTSLVFEGEAGIGKSRLVRTAVEDARDAGLVALVGRSVQHGSSPYRPLTEALFPLARNGGIPDDPQLRPVRFALGRIVPDWRVDDHAGDDAPIVVAEAVLRLLRVVAGASGVVLVVEDLHWADPETVAVIEYLSDNVAHEPIVVIVTTRPEAPSQVGDALAALTSRGSVTPVPLSRLDDDGVRAMVRACASEASDEVVEAITRRSEGLPLLVEELLSVGHSGIADRVPGTFADTVSRRMAGLPAQVVLVLQCAAILGRRFEWELLPGIASLQQSEVVDALERGVAVQLIDSEPEGSFRFHHALTREAIVAAILPPVRAALAERAARLVESRHGDEAVVLAADLRELAGDGAGAVRHLVVAGRRATTAGALASAALLLRRAVALAHPDDDAGVDAREALTEVLALRARVDEAVALGETTLAQLDESEASGTRRARLHLVLARAAVNSTRWSLARHHLELAERLATEHDDEVLLVRTKALAAHAAMGESKLEEAVALARQAADAGKRLDLPEVRCEALEILGRRERMRDLDAAENFFEAAHDIARSNNRLLAATRALHELGTIDMFRSSSPGRLTAARELAVASGALSLAATIDLQLLGLHAFRFETERAIAIGRELTEATRRLGAPDLDAAALLQLAFAHALCGNAADLERCVTAALDVAGDHPEAHALAWGHVRATYSLLSEDRHAARIQLERAIGFARRARGVPGVFPALWALLSVVEGRGREVVDDVRSFEAQAIAMNRAVLGLAEAVIAGREGDAAEASRTFSENDGVLRDKHVPGVRHLARRLAAEAALGDGWGEPAVWLRETMDFFDTTGHDQVAGACAALLRRAGESVPRSRDHGKVPRALRVHGVTSREFDVLVLLARRLTNKEIAEKLFLSARTVEKHVERLLQKIGVRNRSELAAYTWDDDAGCGT